MRRLLLIAVSAALAIAFGAPVATASAASASANQRVIVELAIPADSTADQIASAGDAVLATLPSGSYAVINRYSSIAYIGLSVAPDALGVLSTSPLVAKVHADGSVNASATTAKPAVKKCKRGKSKAAKKKYKKCIAAQKKQKGTK